MMKSGRIDISVLESVLPHGSGINSDWEFKENKDFSVVCRNAFHAMNEVGYYDGWMPFKVTVFKDENGELGFNTVICNENRRKSFYGLKEYLIDTISYSLEYYSENINSGEK